MNGSPQAPVSPDADEQLYGPGFWLAYTANVLLVCANSLTFRYADFIAAIAGQHGTEHLSGEIIQAGLIAAILMRFGLARAIDRYGARLVWLVSSLAFIAGIGLLLTATRLSPLIWISRIAYQVGLAGMFSCSMVHIQNQVPAHRRTEIIGSLGTSGFVGTIIGTFLSDLIFHWFPKGDMQFDAMFGGTLILGAAHAVVVYLLTRNDRHVRPAETPAAIRLLFRYWPGPVMLVAVAMGTRRRARENDRLCVDVHCGERRSRACGRILSTHRSASPRRGPSRGTARRGTGRHCCRVGDGGPRHRRRRRTAGAGRRFRMLRGRTRRRRGRYSPSDCRAACSGPRQFGHQRVKPREGIQFEPKLRDPQRSKFCLEIVRHEAGTGNNRPPASSGRQCRQF